MKIIEKKIAELIPADYNPRVLHDKQHSDLKESLTKFGLVDPVLININPDRKNIIIGGHQRLKIWEELGNKTVSCVELDLTIAQEKELNVRLNKNTGDFDYELLNNLFSTDELLEIGFEEFELNISGDVNLEEFFEDKEIDNNAITEVSEFNIVLEYTEKEYALMIEKLDSMNGTKEDIIFKLLELN